MSEIKLDLLQVENEVPEHVTGARTKYLRADRGWDIVFDTSKGFGYRPSGRPDLKRRWTGLPNVNHWEEAEDGPKKGK